MVDDSGRLRLSISIDAVYFANLFRKNSVQGSKADLDITIYLIEIGFSVSLNLYIYIFFIHIQWNIYKNEIT